MINLGSKTIAVYYHMPFIVYEKGEIYANPVIGIFVKSLLIYFNKIILFGFETNEKNKSITYKLPNDENIEFISLGLEGQFWDHFQNKERLKNILRGYSEKIDILLLRLPSYKAYAVWKYLSMPKRTILLFVGNPLFTSANWYSNVFIFLFRKIRSTLHNTRIKKIVTKTSSVVFANSKPLVEIWKEIVGTEINLLHTSSISSLDMLESKFNKKFKRKPTKLLFVGRISFDKGIRELLEALSILNYEKRGEYTLDIVGVESDMGGFTLDQLAIKYDVLSVINYHGVIPFGKTLFNFYREADSYILPSYHEGMPHTIWEAMSQGAPVISTPVGGVGDFFVNGKDILFIGIKDSKSIVEAIQKLKGDKNLQSILMKNGLKKAFQITRESQSEKMVSILKQNWKLKEVK